MNVLKCNLIAVCAFTVLAGCSIKQADQRYVEMNEDLGKYYHVKADKTKERLIFINEKGCHACITSFSEYILDNMDKYKNNSSIFISSKGQNVDIERFASMNIEDIIISRKAREKGKVIPDLGIVYLKASHNEIDTIIALVPEKIVEQMNYIKKRN